MSKKISISAGTIFAIPLFMPKDDWKLKIKLSENDLNKEFVFGRVIETSSSVLVEIFNIIGSSKTKKEEIINSGIMFSPIQIFWDGIVKKRWKIIYEDKHYNKIEHSNYYNLKMAFPSGPNNDTFRLEELSTRKETIISRKELMIKQYECSAVWFPIDIENRIIKKINWKNK